LEKDQRKEAGDAGTALRGCIMREARVQRLRRELGMGWGMVW
jgi:hypothetical protein